MSLNLFIPSIGDKKTTKDYIIEIIIEGKPLTLRQLENLIKKRYGHSVTYQAIRKAVLLLSDAQVLKKHRKLYSLNQQWIDSLSEFVDRLKTRPRHIVPYEIIHSNDAHHYYVIHFDSLLARRDYLEKFERAIIPTIKNKVVIIQMPHGYHSVFNQRRIMDRMNLFNKHGIKLYRLYRGNSFIDKFSASIYKRYGGKTKLGINYDLDSWFIIYGDWIFQTFLNKEMKEIQEKFFSATSKFDDSYFEFMEKFYYKKSRIKVIIQKNHVLADRLREQSIEYFKSQKKIIPIKCPK
ncbi:MAG: hypothetical protein ABIA37_04465 [Candidatus Woesearchaeota archaeon]